MRIKLPFIYLLRLLWLGCVVDIFCTLLLRGYNLYFLCLHQKMVFIIGISNRMTILIELSRVRLFFCLKIQIWKFNCHSLIELQTLKYIYYRKISQKYATEMLPTQNTNKNKFNFSSAPGFPIQIKLAYKQYDPELKILSLQISQYGKSGGVIFIQTNQGSFVLKPNNQAAQDYFCYLLANMLDLQVPQIQVIGCYEPQFEKLVFLIQKYCHNDQVLYARLKSKLDFPFYQLLQYIPSILHVHIGSQKYQKHMCTEYKTQSVGICLGYDMIINNHDRYKLLWRGEGNMNNILIQLKKNDKWTLDLCHSRDDLSVELGSFVYIDHEGHLIDCQAVQARGNAEKYADMVAQFHLDFIQYLRKESSNLPAHFEKFREQIKFLTQYKYSDEQIVKVCQGIIYITKKFIDCYENGEIKQLHSSIKKPTDTKNKSINYWNEYWNNEFKKVNLNFCELLYVKISAIYTTYPELINQIYARVKANVQKNKRNKNRKNSKASRKSSEMGQKKGMQESKGGDNAEEQDKPIQQEDIQSQEDARKRRWRQKLIEFKNKNYQ